MSAKSESRSVFDFIELMFDAGIVSTSAQVNDQLVNDRLRELGVGPGRDPVPMLPALRPVIPGGGLRPGSIVCVEGPAADSLGLALAAGPSQAGAWCAVVGMPEAGIVAAAGMGVDPDRLLLVDVPGRRWPDVVAALMDAVDLVLLRPSGRPVPEVVRRLMALARRQSCVIAVAGPWDGAQIRFRVESSEWIGVARGSGHLRGRRALVTARGRGAAGLVRQAWLWLPGPDGVVAPLAAAPLAAAPVAAAPVAAAPVAAVPVAAVVPVAAAAPAVRPLLADDTRVGHTGSHHTGSHHTGEHTEHTGVHRLAAAAG